MSGCLLISLLFKIVSMKEIVPQGRKCPTRWKVRIVLIREAFTRKNGNSLVFYQTRGGEVPPDRTISVFFQLFFYCFKMIYMLWIMKISNNFFLPNMPPPSYLSGACIVNESFIAYALKLLIWLHLRYSGV